MRLSQHHSLPPNGSGFQFGPTGQSAAKCCQEARDWLPGVVTCQTKTGTEPQSADLLPLDESRRLITQRTQGSLARRKEIRPIHPKDEAVTEQDMLVPQIATRHRRLKRAIMELIIVKSATR